MKAFEIEYISEEGEHVRAIEEAEKEASAIGQLCAKLEDKPHQIISIDFVELPSNVTSKQFQ